MRSLNELGAPDVQPSRGDAGDGGNAHRRFELAKWLSDWHLLSFLGTSGLLSEVTKIPPVYASCSLNGCFTPIFDSPRAMRKFLFASLLRRIWRMILPCSTRYWRQRVGRPSPPLHAKAPVRHFINLFIASHRVNLSFRLTYLFFITAQRPARPAPDAPPTRIMDDDIPPELFDEVATPAHGNGQPSGNVRVCPHCTFENTNSGNDCEVCGLPL